LESTDDIGKRVERNLRARGLHAPAAVQQEAAVRQRPTCSRGGGCEEERSAAAIRINAAKRTRVISFRKPLGDRKTPADAERLGGYLQARGGLLALVLIAVHLVDNVPHQSYRQMKRVGDPLRASLFSM
jgi:hypothetical protein